MFYWPKEEDYPQSIFPGSNAQFVLLMRAFHHLDKRIDQVMAKVDDVAAKVAANTAMVRKIADTVTSISEGHSTLSDEIQALKDQIAAGQAPDFSAVDAALADQTAAVGALGALVPASV